MSGRILVVALNPALDVTHELARVDWSGVNRPAAVLVRAGGKGLNVARTLHALGADVLLLGLTGGGTGQAVASGFGATGIPAAFVQIGGETRRTFAVADAERRQTALFNEPGPAIAPGEYAAFAARYDAELAQSAAVVLTGSLPTGLAVNTYGELTRLAAAAGVPVVLDAEGQALLCGTAAAPAIVKPNLAELESAVGRTLRWGEGEDGDLAAVLAAAGELRDAGAQAVVVTLGSHGLLAVTGGGVWRAVPPALVTVNATGAGDAVVAGLTHQFVGGQPWPERLRHAVALGSAAAAAPAAGEFKAADYQRMLAEVTVTPIAGAPRGDC